MRMYLVSNVLCCQMQTYNFFSKMFICNYFSKSISSPSKYSQEAAMHIHQQDYHLSEHLESSSAVMALRAYGDFVQMPSIGSKQFYRSGFLSLGNSQRSHGSKMGRQSDCETIRTGFLAKIHGESMSYEMVFRFQSRFDALEAQKSTQNRGK